MIVSILPPLAKGFVLSASLIVSIGAQNMFVLRQGLRREHVLPVVLFCAVADSVLVIAGVNGLGQLLAALPGLSAGLSLGGAAFLTWYAVGAFRRAMRSEALIIEDGAGLSLRAALAATAAFTLLNPHVYIDTVMLMGAVGSSLPESQRLFFIIGASTFAAVWFASVGFGARFLAPLFARPIAWRVLDVVTGLMMTVIAVVLVRGVFA
ncbi:LysE/ArgO family amino acid transporter [Brevundimonas diminuta]|uniref:LysE/ArgO family amino acid transporter n=1 Tax=Brevundimonas diminuta TaxID=293 RepID=UPI000207E874|nr:LysE family transporter [Brevundimonas diminuta]EGF96477.1 arginine exporter protein argO [Brevundimonas diminuta ATCC 11568]OWR18005.1 amino acid transporter [Brevundimonas diminuta]WQE44485.1 LysE family transporter [Brevundimonas diminuta]SUW16997.1 Arginine exporter protein ArgO [Brevundimonas diminuta]